MHYVYILLSFFFVFFDKREFCTGWLCLAVSDTIVTYKRSTTLCGSSQVAADVAAEDVLIEGPPSNSLQIRAIYITNLLFPAWQIIFIVYALSCNPAETLRQRLFFELTFDDKGGNEAWRILFPGSVILLIS